MMAKIVVTGGHGFIGTNLTRELRERGNEVWPSDITHSTDQMSVRCDVSSYRQVDNLCEMTEPDFVYHAAAEYGRWNGEAHYENLWQSNAIGTKNLLRAQEKYGFRMIFFGSAEVYGDYDGVMTEDVMDKIPIRQMNDYALTKWVNELQILNSAKMNNTETVRVRLFNVYGPHEHYNPYRGVVPVFIYRSLHGLPYTVYKGHKRTFEYVVDIVKSLANIIDNFKPGEVYNLGSDTQYTIEELSDLVQKHTGGDGSKVTFKEAEPFTTRVKIAPSEKAKKDIGHRITIPLDEGIRRTVEWFKQAYRMGD
ncbi:MAG: NAD(P)-dependent oxidoreductase [Candidatus Thorarchaeota archaeon]|nr:MAG: NAD(P)-dependent oxidoreductase [Candidatus Thorarchaeota archaeon]RLI57523.1 MAG: NAD(P)-dependent oxidoreductase [Candidatus Thorarchaeota archaeon]